MELREVFTVNLLRNCQKHVQSKRTYSKSLDDSTPLLAKVLEHLAKVDLSHLQLSFAVILKVRQHVVLRAQEGDHVRAQGAARD